MKKISLMQGNIALVDDEDFELISLFDWSLRKGRYTNYASFNLRIDGKMVTIMMHRLIMNMPHGVITDHVDRNGLNNQRHNLRRCTYSQNSGNSNNLSRGKSLHRGVHFRQETGKWVAKCGYDYLGAFETELEASIAYNEKAKEVFGEFAYLNTLLTA